MTDEPIYFPSAAAFRDWLEVHHETEKEVLVGFYKKGTGRPTMTWSESVDEALCFGWIDGVRRSVDEERYTIRFTPRKPGSVWSKVNVAKAEELIRQGRMRPAGLKAFENRKDERSGIYSFEQDSPPALTEEMLSRLRADERAWRFWESQPPSYRKAATWWVVSAKREETRLRRFETLLADSAAGRKIGPMRRSGE